MIHLTILNLKEKIFDGNVESITLPGEAGELTVLTNHVPIVTAMKQGAMNALMSGEEPFDAALGRRKYFESKGGIFEFNNNEATILL
ncbi:MAG: F0F1 ATP synthase subunit epsilon [Candidatus Spechtbacteria bacterium]|nr:F0F1 ATP synthase subunit epsilon [Candidatus Spechtbacteria bacterium]